MSNPPGARRPTPLSLLVGLTVVALGAASPASAAGFPFDWGVRLEPGLAFPVGDPQATNLGVGFGLALKGGIAPVKLPVGALEVFAALQFMGFSAHNGSAAGALGVGVGARYIWRTERFWAPWADLDLGYVAAGADSRDGTAHAFGFGFAVGVAFGLLEERQLWVGPYLRFETLTSLSSAPGMRDDTTGKFLILGASVEWGTPHPGNVVHDRDHDGIPDDVDKCPDEAEDKDNFQDDDGCPELDNDKDGVLDDVDRCPTELGPRETFGCPDTDKDGLPDNVDKCPTEAGPKDNGGCPRVATGVTIGDGKLELRDKIYFAHDKAEILEKSYPILNQVVDVLKQNATLKVRIEGHTDKDGSAKHNLELSQERAASVRDYLVASGINVDRLEAKGYGFEQPLESNKTPEGRERNRRVEFTIIK